MPTKGVLYVAYGDAAVTQFIIANRALAKRHPRWNCAVICEKPIKPRRNMVPFECIRYHSTHLGARDAKLRMDLLAPWDWVLYMDADTRVRYSIDAVWDILADGWEMAAVPTGTKTRTGVMRHVFCGDNGLIPEGLEERNATIEECGGWPCCQLQGGIWAFRKTPAVARFFEVWREEWERWRDQDQPAAARAYRRAPVKWFPLGWYFNGGPGVGHFHAHARRRGLKGSIAR